MANDHDEIGGSRNALSRKDAIDLTKTGKGNAEELVDLTGSDEEEEDEDHDLKLAIALSLQDQIPDRGVSQTNPSDSVDKPLTDTTTQDASSSLQHVHAGASVANTGSSLHILNRKQMEVERLARLKRKREATAADDRPISPPPLRRNTPQTNGHALSLVSKRAKPDPAPHSSASNHPNLVSSLFKANVIKPHLQYPDGRVFLTSENKSQDRSISFSNLLKPTEPSAILKSALLSTFIVDFDWLLPHFNTRVVSFVLALHAGSEEEKRLIQQDFTDIPNVRLVFPRVGGIVNCMHSKVMLLFYEDASNDARKARCRIAVPSANLVPWDWGVGGVMENTVFVIDLPLKDSTSSPSNENRTRFHESLVQMLQAMGTPENVVTKLERFDFSATSKYSFIHTIGGSHLLPAKEKQTSLKSFVATANTHAKTSTTISASPPRTGLLSLSDAVYDMNLTISQDDPSFPPKLDFITSSLGNLKPAFLQSLFTAACGLPLPLSTDHKKAPKQTSARSDKAQAGSQDLAFEDIVKHVKAYFPSDQTVCNSKGGNNAAGTICFQSKWWHSTDSSFPKTIVTDCVGSRKDGMLMHSKILFVRFARPRIAVKIRESSLRSAIDPKDNDVSAAAAYAGWIYLGSANLSESAWGSCVKDSKTKHPKLNCRNWESGVLLPVLAKPEHQGQNLHDLTLQEVFGHIVPVPIDYPGVNLVESGKHPWFFQG